MNNPNLLPRATHSNIHRSTHQCTAVLKPSLRVTTLANVSMSCKICYKYCQNKGVRAVSNYPENLFLAAQGFPVLFHHFRTVERTHTKSTSETISGETVIQDFVHYGLFTDECSANSFCVYPSRDRKQFVHRVRLIQFPINFFSTKCLSRSDECRSMQMQTISF